MQGRQAQWVSSGRCGGGSDCRKVLGRRTERRQDSPDTLPLCERWEKYVALLLCCRGRCSMCDQCRPGTRTCHSLRVGGWLPPLFFWFLCKLSQQKPSHPTQPPSNSGRSEHFQRRLGSRNIAPVLRSSCLWLTGCQWSHRGWHWLYLGPVWHSRHLSKKNTIIQSFLQVWQQTFQHFQSYISCTSASKDTLYFKLPAACRLHDGLRFPLQTWSIFSALSLASCFICKTTLLDPQSGLFLTASCAETGWGLKLLLIQLCKHALHNTTENLLSWVFSQIKSLHFLRCGFSLWAPPLFILK